MSIEFERVERRLDARPGILTRIREIKPQLTASEYRSTKSADGRMAAEADELHRRPLDVQGQLQNRLDTSRPSHRTTWPGKPLLVSSLENAARRAYPQCFDRKPFGSPPDCANLHFFVLLVEGAQETRFHGHYDRRCRSCLPEWRPGEMGIRAHSLRNVAGLQRPSLLHVHRHWLDAAHRLGHCPSPIWKPYRPVRTNIFIGLRDL
jgi:hypothetical protein